MSATWGPFAAGLDPGELKARCRALRLAVRLLCGPRGRDAEIALLRVEVAGGDADLLAEAEAEFERMTAVDRRRVLSSYMAVA